MHRDHLPVPKPCPADWSAMTGDARRRFCGSCRKHVHDLSAMTAAEAEALVARGGDLCVRYTADARGEVRHRPARGARWLALGAALVAAPALASSAPAPSEEPGLVERLVRYVSEIVWAAPPAPEVEVVGELVAPPPPPPPKEEVVMGKMVKPPKIDVVVEPRPEKP